METVKNVVSKVKDEVVEMVAPKKGGDVKPGQGRSLMWFRKGLRLHDNPALLFASKDTAHLFPIFILDPWFLKPDPSAPSPGSQRVGINRITFLLQSLKDLDTSLRQQGSRLLVLNGNPVEVIPDLLKKWEITKLCFERDTEPYALSRDKAVMELAGSVGVEVIPPTSHTLYDPDFLIAKAGGTMPTSYGAFCKLLDTSPPPPQPPPTSLPPIPGDLKEVAVGGVPTLKELGYEDPPGELMTPGGETEGLKRLELFIAKKDWIAAFEKPKTDPTAFMEPATTVLSPYMKFGCVSARLFYVKLQEVYREKKKYSKPPVSLEGQLLWREFFYTVGYNTPNFDRMEGNRICKQIPWLMDEERLAVWRDAKTGYPWIDAAMTQLREQGWMHHLARHAVACFLTRGDLYVSWELGRDVFDRLLIDGDWSINNGNWMWLSASCFFYQYHRIYSPITFGKKYDPEGKYVRRFLPVLRDMPKQFIYEPWTAPIAVQKKAKCIIGKDYPHPIVDHKVAQKECRERMAAAYAANKGEKVDAPKSPPKTTRQRPEKTSPSQKKQKTLDHLFKK